MALKKINEDWIKKFQGSPNQAKWATSSPHVQSMPITTKVVSSNPAHGEVYSIQLYVIKFVSDMRQVYLPTIDFLKEVIGGINDYHCLNFLFMSHAESC
jgi:hypothetical protein